MERSDGMLGLKQDTLGMVWNSKALLSIICVKVRSAGCPFLELDLEIETRT